MASGRRSRNSARSSSWILSVALGLIACITMVREASRARFRLLMIKTTRADATGGLSVIPSRAGTYQETHPSRGGSPLAKPGSVGAPPSQSP